MSCFLGSGGICNPSMESCKTIWKHFFPTASEIFSADFALHDYFLDVVGRCCRGALLEKGSQDPVATRVPT